MKILFTFCILLVLSLTGYSQKKAEMKFLNTPGKQKLQSHMEKKAKYFASYETPAIKNTAQASYILISHNENRKDWILSERETPDYYPETTLIRELVNSYYLEGNQSYVDYRKMVYEYEELRPTKIEYYYTSEGKQWEMMSYIEQEFDFRGEQIYYAYYSRDWETHQMVLNYGYKAEDEYNQDDILIRRTWLSYDWDQWIPDYREVYILNENGVVVEIYFAWYNEFADNWQYDEWVVFTLNANEQWAEATMYAPAQGMVKPIYLLGSGTQAGWNNTAAMEMTYLGDGEFGVVA